jgi:diguanylate cyclase (GGDEF)-like protein
MGEAREEDQRQPIEDWALARQEARIEWLAWAVRIITIILASFPAIFASVTMASETWHYVGISLLVALAVGFGIPGAVYVRRLHTSLLRRYQAQLVMRTMELQELATHDELTHLYNRRYFYECVQSELERARVNKQPLALLLLDVDGLKAINDEYGHSIGDAVIANLAKVIARHTRNTDVPARLGGDEFGVLMRDTDKRGAFALAQRLWEELERTPMYEQDGKRIMVSVSIGVSGYPWGGEDVDEMMHWADADMYANKLSRRLSPQPVTGGDGATDVRSLVDELAQDY